MIRELHDLTHRIPGVPGHREHPHTRHARSEHRRKHQAVDRTRHHGAEPRVLVRWQRWIASLAPRLGDADTRHH